MRLTLQQARRRLGWSVDELAAKSGVHRSTLYRLEAGAATNPSHATARRLEDALGLPPGSLVFGTTSGEVRHAR